MVVDPQLWLGSADSMRGETVGSGGACDRVETAVQARTAREARTVNEARIALRTRCGSLNVRECHAIDPSRKTQRSECPVRRGHLHDALGRVAPARNLCRADDDR